MGFLQAREKKRAKHPSPNTTTTTMADEVNETDVDTEKRRFLVVATSIIGGVGVVATAVPFVVSMQPSERAKAAGAPIEVDISKIEVGQKIDVEWREIGRASCRERG